MAPVFSPGRFRAWAHVRGVPLDALAEVAGLSPGAVRAYQYGHPSAHAPTPATLTAWTRLLGCTLADLHSTTPHETAEYWRGASRAMGPMSQEQIQAIADILDRTARPRHDA